MEIAKEGLGGLLREFLRALLAALQPGAVGAELAAGRGRAEEGGEAALSGLRGGGVDDEGGANGEIRGAHGIAAVLPLYLEAQQAL